MAKTAAGLRALAEQVLIEAKERARELRAKAVQLEAQEDQALLRKLKSSGRLQALKDELLAAQEAPSRKAKEQVPPAGGDEDLTGICEGDQNREL